MFILHTYVMCCDVITMWTQLTQSYHFFVVRTIKIYSLSNFQVYKTVFLQITFVEIVYCCYIFTLKVQLISNKKLYHYSGNCAVMLLLIASSYLQFLVIAIQMQRLNPGLGLRTLLKDYSRNGILNFQQEIHVCLFFPS